MSMRARSPALAASKPAQTGPAAPSHPRSMGLAERLPPWLRPREGDDDLPPSRRRWRAETLVVLAVGLLLGAAVVRDVVRQVGIDERAVIDKRTWVHYAHRQLKLIDVRAGIRSNVDVACARPARAARMRLCLIIGGSAHVPLRAVRGGYQLPLTGLDRYRSRSGCFGLARRRKLCANTAGGP